MSFPRAVGLGFVALLVAACGFVETGPPDPTPADFPGIAIEFQKRGLHVDDPVSGDAGCNDSVLAPTAISFDVSGEDQADAGQDVPVRLPEQGDVRTSPLDDRRLRALVRDRPRRPTNRSSSRRSCCAGQGPWAPSSRRRSVPRSIRGGNRRLAVARTSGMAKRPWESYRRRKVAQTTRKPRIFRAMTSRWTWLVPSPISVSLASRR